MRAWSVNGAWVSVELVDGELVARIMVAGLVLRASPLEAAEVAAQMMMRRRDR